MLWLVNKYFLCLNAQWEIILKTEKNICLFFFFLQYSFSLIFVVFSFAKLFWANITCASSLWLFSRFSPPHAMALRNLSWFTNGCAGHEKRGCNFPRQYLLISTKTSLVEAFKAQSNLKVRLNVSCSLWMDTLKFKRGSGYYTTALLLYCPKTSSGEKRVKFNRITRKWKTFFEPTWRPWTKKKKKEYWQRKVWNVQMLKSSWGTL